MSIEMFTEAVQDGGKEVKRSPGVKVLAICGRECHFLAWPLFGLNLIQDQGECAANSEDSQASKLRHLSGAPL